MNGDFIHIKRNSRKNNHFKGHKIGIRFSKFLFNAILKPTFLWVPFAYMKRKEMIQGQQVPNLTDIAQFLL